MPQHERDRQNERHDPGEAPLRVLVRMLVFRFVVMLVLVAMTVLRLFAFCRMA